MKASLLNTFPPSYHNCPVTPWSVRESLVFTHHDSLPKKTDPTITREHLPLPLPEYITVFVSAAYPTSRPNGQIRRIRSSSQPLRPTRKPMKTEETNILHTAPLVTKSYFPQDRAVCFITSPLIPKKGFCPSRPPIRKVCTSSLES
jgi:hypothetical protein